MIVPIQTLRQQPRKEKRISIRYESQIVRSIHQNEICGAKTSVQKAEHRKIDELINMTNAFFGVGSVQQAASLYP